MKKNKSNSKYILIAAISIIVIVSIFVVFSYSELFSTNSTEDSFNPFFLGAYLEYTTQVDVELGNSTEKISNTVFGIMRQDVVESTSDYIILNTSSSGELGEIIGDEGEKSTLSKVMKGETLFSFNIELMDIIGEETIQTEFGDKQVVHIRSDTKSLVEGGTLREIQNIYVGKNNSVLYLVESSSVTETVYLGSLVTSSTIIRTWLSDTNLEWLK